jgi:hypothetical protein
MVQQASTAIYYINIASATSISGDYSFQLINNNNTAGGSGIPAFIYQNSVAASAASFTIGAASYTFTTLQNQGAGTTAVVYFVYPYFGNLGDTANIVFMDNTNSIGYRITIICTAVPTTSNIGWAGSIERII